MILQRLAWLSQIALVVAAILGYIFTVRPVHQKQLLDEQIAERTISLNATTVTLENLKSEAARLRTENSKLGTEAKETYEQLRTNLSFKLLSISDRCAVKANDIPPRNSSDIPACVMNFAKEIIAPGLRPKDRAILFAIIERHGAQMITSGADVNRRFAAKASQLDKDLKKTKSDLEGTEPDVRAEILRLRAARAGGQTLEQDPPTGRIIIRADEDQQAYDNYVTRRRQLIDRTNDLNREKVFFDVDFESAYRDALAKISSQILDEFGNNIRKP